MIILLFYDKVMSITKNNLCYDDIKVLWDDIIQARIKLVEAISKLPDSR